MAPALEPCTADEMQRAWIGKCVYGEGFAHFCACAGLWGVLVWGRPSDATAVALGRTLVLELDPRVAPHVSLFDCSRMAGAEPSAFKRLTTYVQNYGHLLQRQVRCVAIVRPSGLEGAIVAGVPEVLELPYPVKVFDGSAAALAWLDEAAGGDPPPSSFAGALDELFQRGSATSPVVGALRELLDRNLHGLTLAGAAKLVGVSERSLQRKLGEADTSFQQELADARIRTARRLLLETDAPLTTIALEVGCASLQHFSALFRKRTGESPSAWRRNHRG